MPNRIHARVIGSVALTLTLVACGQAGSGSKPGASADSAKQAIQATEEKMNSELAAKNSSAFADHYGDDAQFAAEGIAPTDGQTEIQKIFTNASTDPAFELKFAADGIEVANSGDLAYSHGHYTEKYTDPKTHKVMQGAGAYVTVYKKQDDGSWKIVEDFAAADPDATKPVAPGKPATRAKMTSF